MTDEIEDRRSAGRGLRDVVPRSAHVELTVSLNRRDPVDVLEGQAATRIRDLVSVRYGRMAESPFAFLRGAAAIMAMDLASTPTTGVQVQLCGDAHVRNFGTFATPDRNLAFSINDFDESLPGPWEWDVKRLAASLHVVARQHGFPPDACDQIVRTAVREYRDRMADYATKRTLELWYDRIDVDDVIAHFPPKHRPAVARDVRKAARRDHVRAVAKLTGSHGGDVRLLEDPPLVVHLEKTEHAWDEVTGTFDVYRSSLPDDRRRLIDRYRIVDVARRVVGVGSVGTRCWVCLFERSGHPGGDRVILQVKEAQPSVLEPYLGGSDLGPHGRRVVAGQRLMQGATDIFLGWCEGPETGRQYYVRQLWDHKGRSDLTRMSRNNLSYHAALCAWALARAHARSGDAARISSYLGSSARFDKAIAVFADEYATTNERDHAALLEAIAAGRVQARAGL